MSVEYIKQNPTFKDYKKKVKSEYATVIGLPSAVIAPLLTKGNFRKKALTGLLAGSAGALTGLGLGERKSRMLARNISKDLEKNGRN